MVQGGYSADPITLSADTDNWKEQLYLARQQREQRGWKLIAILPQSTERLKALSPLLHRAAVVVVLLFQHPQREKTLEVANNQRALVPWATCHPSS